METDDSAGSASEIDFNTLCDPLTQVVNSTRVPLTSILLHAAGKTYRKTLIADKPPPSSYGLQSDDIGRDPERRTSPSEAVPEVLTELGVKELDVIGGQTIYAISSLGKLLIALTCCIIVEKKAFQGVRWNTPVFSYINGSRGGPCHIFQGSIFTEPTLEQILVHYKALPAFQRFLFLADGTWQIAEEDFIEHLENIVTSSINSDTKKEESDMADYEYSNLNYILVAYLLEKAARKSIDKILQEHLFGPLDMNRTVFDRETLIQKDRTGNVAKGQRISGDLRTYAPAPRKRYMDSTASIVTVGAWSCIDDLAKLFSSICQPLSGKPGRISSRVVERFLTIQKYEDKSKTLQMMTALAGRVYDLRTPNEGRESLNYSVRQLKSHNTQDSSRTARYPTIDEDLYPLYYKGGTSDGFTSTVYFDPSKQIFAVVLSNAAGPVDVTEPIARYLFLTAIDSRNPAAIKAHRDALEDELPAQIERACSLWQQLEAEDADLASWNGDIQPYIGLYQHEYGLKLQITKRGEAIFERKQRHLTTMRIGVKGTRLRLFPALEGLFIDRLSFYQDLELRVEKRDGIVALVAHEGEEVYTKQ